QFVEPLPQSVDADLYPKFLFAALPELLERKIRLSLDPAPQSLVVSFQPGAAVSAPLFRFHRSRFHMARPITLHASLRNLEPLGYGLCAMPFLARQHDPLPQLPMIAFRRHGLIIGRHPSGKATN